MTRPIGKKIKTSRTRGDRNQTYRSVLGAQTPSIITIEHRRGRISDEEAVNRFEKTNTEGRLRAGQLALELAHRDRTGDGSEWLYRAKNNFDDVLHTCGLSKSSMTNEAARAAILLAQLPIHASMIGSGGLADPHVVRTAYEHTAEQAEKIVNDYHNGATRTSDSERRGNIRGVLSEAAVLLLAQRYAVNKIGNGSWLPLLSSYSGDHANKHASHTNHAWDMSIFTDIGRGVSQAYQVQIKSTDRVFENDARPDEEGITRVNVDPGLRLPGDNSYSLQSTIIHHIHGELEGADFLAQKLDARTDLLLDILG